MQLLRQPQLEVLSAALDRLPINIRRAVEHVDLFCADPIFAGFCDDEIFEDGRSKRDTMFCCYGWGQYNLPVSKRKTTIVCPDIKCVSSDPFYVVPFMIHELGHVFDEYLGCRLNVVPVTEYAESNRWEAFAEFFTAYLVPGYLWWGNDGLYRDKKAIAVMDYFIKTNKIPDWI